MEGIVVKGAPAEYICKVGVLGELEEKLSARGIRKALLLTGDKSWKALQPYFPVLEAVDLTIVKYCGESSLAEIARIGQIAKAVEADAIIGAGGGKVLDIAKGVAHDNSIRSVLVPTLASNCAPWTPLSVVYSEEGTMTHFTVYPESVDLLLVEPRILLDAPVSLLVAGIGDTIAKWYEADVQISRFEDPPIALKVSHYTAKLCADEMFQNAESAIADAEQGKLSQPFIKVVETIIMLGGMVGGFGDKYGRVAGAHAIHNGMTLSPESHHALHGDKVAYGVLVQLVLERKFDEIEKLAAFYKKIGLPVSLEDLNIPSTWIEAIAVQSTRENETIHVLQEEPVTAEKVAAAMRELEELMLVK
ncbi:iron-containing alcohol dehydrogenase family protein [Planomicrobium sp. CPCC 101110]|uniref:iron-containing alcohol dehydrogenase family protein n=1 Tax=Planomicrobium sp. CPCC 101110 TaxID=2599619 RepID=UPI0011B7C313|nr:iron-containing alcohol dehydrogenase family protein [Planomicrobium sp. CPCC 101110]TWT25749.1 iron-containing alcohol dehydrogenase family protein [Planomicrobium sp. CPCC 101110]